MHIPRYEFVTEENAELFTFTSEGPNGRVKKLVIYSQMLQNDIYNLALGDFNETTGEIDDDVRTNNNDSKKVLATVPSTLYVFFSTHPNAWIYASWSTRARTRLYRIGLTNNLEHILSDFVLYGLKNEQWQEFESGQEYDAFLVKRKPIKFVKWLL